MNAIVPFASSTAPGSLSTYLFKLTPIRVVIIGDDPWFVARDVCHALSLANPRTSLNKLDADEKGVHSMDTLGGRQELAIVSEAGLYTLIMRCRDATTPDTLPHTFRKWVTGTVLPQIRKTGSYAPVPVDPMAMLQDPNVLRGLLATFAERTLRLESENRGLTHSLAVTVATVEAQAPIVEAYGEIMDADGTVCITDAAKLIGVRPSDLHAHMRDREAKAGWIYGRPGVDEVAFQPRLARAELAHKLVRIERSDGTVHAKSQVRITSKGLFLLRAELVQKERDRRRKAGQFDL